MKHSCLPFRLSGRLLGVLLLGAGSVLVRGQDVPLQLAPVVTTATRIPESVATVGTDIEAISGMDLERQQLQTFSDALSGVPGAPEFASGQIGASTSAFLRGANSDQVLFLVDGVRLNDANADYGPFLGGARVFPSDQIEIARGPQSTLYGSEAVGGVVSLSLQKGSGPLSGTLSGEAGSFGTVDGMLAVQGAGGPWAYTVAAAESHTDNERINNAFDSENLALRFDRQLTPSVAVGATLRGLIDRYGDPSDEYTNDPSAYEKERNGLATIFADIQVTPSLTSHVTLGGQDRRFEGVDPLYDLDTLVVNRRGSIDWQNTAELPLHNRLVAGIDAEVETTLDTGYGDIDQRQTLLAVYAEDEWRPGDGVSLTGGLRHDDFDTFGSATTGRATAAWLVPGHAVKLRGSYGTGFNAPSFLDLYGVAAGYIGNPHLQPERSRGWDAGIDVYAPDKTSALSATWFETDFDDLIVDNFNVSPYTTENVGRARTRGFELSLKTVLFGRLQAKLAYTRLESFDLTDGTELSRRPSYNAAADVWSELGYGISLGAGASWVGTRLDYDPLTFGNAQDPSYAVSRIYAAWKVSTHLTLRVRVENLFNAYYEPVNGYPALSRGFYGGAEWKF